ncbi:MAG: cardiolipin synthase ClsB [Bacteroidia bacterium]|nr:cardiolipin synthase ClsB [Bacteroidia bacterium]
MEKELPKSSGDKVQLVHGGIAYFSLLKKLIRGAQDSIYIQTYIFEEDQTGIEVANELRVASQRQVRVFLLVDGFASSHLSKYFINNLEEAGVNFRMFGPLLKSKYFYLGRRLHHKVVVVDAKYSLVGGINISNRYNDMPDQPAWLDWAVYAEGDVAAQLTDICRQRMQRTSLKNFVRPRKILHPIKNNVVSIKINDWVRGKREITKSYLSMFRKAKESIIIMSAYFLPNAQFRKELMRAAQRGVKVQVILAGPSDVSLSKYAERYMYRWLLKNGIEIYEYQKSVLHGKMAVYDNNWATVGSYNVNNISAYASIELNLAVNDRAFGNQVESAFNTIMVNDCLRISAEQMNHSSLVRRIMQHGAYYIFRILFFLFTFYFKQRD